MIRFALVSFLGAALLFLVQPLLAAFILPWFGGTPAVWTACLLFFQLALLLGYAWAHLVRHRPWVHLALVAISLIFLPITPDVSWQPRAGDEPILRVLSLLAATVGLPFVALAATAPLIQARAAALGGARVHRLYAASNAGSLLGLLAFPFAFQPLAGAINQTHLWSMGFAVFALLLASLPRTAPATVPAPGLAPRRGDRLLWLGFSTIGCALLLAVTEAMSQDLSVTPLLWVLPLALYLLSFIAAFGAERWTSRRVFGPLFVLALAVMVTLLHLGYRTHWLLQLGGWCGALFLACTLCHGELVRRRPGPGFLTGFYLWIAAGGALGGLLVGVVAPRIFSFGLELHLTLLGGWLLFVVRRDHQETLKPREGQRLLLIALTLALAAGLGLHAWNRARGADLFRSFFGTLSVKSYPLAKTGGSLVHLLDGRISHGFQYTDEGRRRRPTAYFAAETGVGRLLARPGERRHIGIVGLGAGTLAAYGRPGDRLRFYEINPDVIRVAQTRFTWLADSAAEITVIEGDGRLAIQREKPNDFDILVLDAFSGDAIPTHLITTEALGVYRQHLRPQGYLAINVSNRHAHLTRVVRALAAEAGLSWIFIRHEEPSPLGPYRSDWMILASSPQALDFLRDFSRDPPGADEAPVPWTDDFAPLLPLLTW